MLNAVITNTNAGNPILQTHISYLLMQPYFKTRV